MFCDNSEDFLSGFSYSGGDTSGKIEELEGSEVSINVKSFTGAAVVLKVGRKLGMENVELLTDNVSEKSVNGDPPASGLWNTLSK